MSKLCRIFGHRWFAVDLPWEDRDCCDRCGTYVDEAASEPPSVLAVVTCDLIGHSLDPMECDYVGATCFRCRSTFLDEAPRSDLGFWLTWYNARRYIPSRWRSLVAYIRPCDECGRRLCKRPNDDEHIPF